MDNSQNICSTNIPFMQVPPELRTSGLLRPKQLWLKVEQRNWVVENCMQTEGQLMYIWVCAYIDWCLFLKRLIKDIQYI